MKKIIAAILISIMCMVIFVGCNETGISKATDNDIVLPDRFITISETNEVFNDNHSIFVDKETGVMYWYIRGGYHAGITVLLNSDGTPMLYDLENNTIVKEDKR